MDENEIEVTVSFDSAPYYVVTGDTGRIVVLILDQEGKVIDVEIEFDA